MPNAMPVTEPVVRSRVLRGTSSASLVPVDASTLGYTGATPVLLTTPTRPTQGFVSAIDPRQLDHRVTGAVRRSRESVRKGRVGMSDFRRAPLHEMTRDLAATARGHLHAALVVRGRTLVSVTSGEVLPIMGVAV